MLDIGLISTIGFIHLVALISPGPDFVVACRNTLLYSRAVGFYTAIGFGLGIMVHISYAVFGLSWLIANHSFVFAIIHVSKYSSRYQRMEIRISGPCPNSIGLR